jgi:hypothetical protein
MAVGSRPWAQQTTRSPIGESRHQTALELSARETGGGSQPRPSGTRTERLSAHRLRSGNPRVLSSTDRTSRRLTRACLSAHRRHATESHKRQLRGQRAPRPPRSGFVRAFSCSSVKHLHGCGLITGALRQEAAELLSALVLSGRMLGGFQVLRAPVGCDDCSEIR